MSVSVSQNQPALRVVDASFATPMEARPAGIETIYQGLALCEDLDAPANMQDAFEVADRLLVMRRGRLVGERQPNATTASELVGLMVGVTEGRR